MGIRLVVLNQKTDQRYTVFVDSNLVTIGRAASNDIRLPFPVVSSRHLSLSRENDEWRIRDLGSTNGTQINNSRLPPGKLQALRQGDQVSIGSIFVTFHDDASQQASDHTLAQTGTLVRKLVADAMNLSTDTNSAFLESVSGPSKGRRVTIEDTLQGGVVGGAVGKLMTLEGVVDHAFSIGRHEYGFELTPLDSPVQINGDLKESAHALASKDRIKVGKHTLVFFDPLEALLEKEVSEATSIDLGDPKESEHSSPPSTSDTPAQNSVLGEEAVEQDTLEPSQTEDEESAPDAGRGLSPLEIGLIAIAGLLVVAGLITLSVLLGLF